MSAFDPSGAPWPYEDPVTDEVGASDPRWRCEDGTCQCDAVHETSPPPHEMTIVLCDRVSRRMPGARCRVHAGGRLLNDAPYADGAGRIVARSRVPIEQVLIEWAPSNTPVAPELPYRRLYYVEIDPADRAEATRRRLHNLGYSRGFTLEENVRDFQRMYGLPRTDQWQDVEGTVIAFHDQHAVPPTDTPRSAPILDDVGPAGPDSSLHLVSFQEPGDALGVAPREARRGPGAPPQQGPQPPPPVGAPTPGTGTLTAQKMPRVYRFSIEWVNPSSPWLSGSTANGGPVEKIELTADGQAVPRLKGSTLGKLVFEIPGTLVKDGLVVELDARFAPSFGPYKWPSDRGSSAPTAAFPPAGHARKHCVFFAQQRFVLDGSQELFVPKNTAPMAGEHPLIDHMVLDDRSANVATSVVTLHTEVVDVTPLFLELAGGIGGYERVYKAQVKEKILDGEPWTNVRALGYTGKNGPAIWMTYVPDMAVKSSAIKLPCFLLCRHELYNRQYSSQDGKVSWAVGSATDSVVAMLNFWGQWVLSERNKASDDPLFEVGWPYAITAGFGPAVVASGVELVTICPIPNFGVPLGLGGTDPKRHLDSVLRTLWAGGWLATGAPSAPSAGRVAIGAWSEGGLTMRELFLKNRTKKDDDPTRLDLAAVYAFDPNEIHLLYPDVLKWLDVDKTAFFGLTMGQNMPPHAWAGQAFYKMLAAAPASVQSRVIGSPNADESLTFWVNTKKEPAKKPSPHWVATVSGPAGSADLLDEKAANIGGYGPEHYRHSFARFGRPFAGSRDTFLLAFLKKTKF